MRLRCHIPAEGPKQFASALMLWLVALLLAAAAQPAASFNAPIINGMSIDAARSGDLPVHRSIAAGMQSRVALMSERAREASPASGFEGPDAALVPDVDLVLPVHRTAIGSSTSGIHSLTWRASGYRARAPPILA